MRDERLRAAAVLWLTTVDPGGQPQTSPVWFHWDGRDVVVFSRPDARKVANVRGDPRVALHLDGAAPDDTVVTGEARAACEPVDAARRAAYAEKYAAWLARLGTTADAYLAEFVTPIVLRPTRWRVYRSD